jgi:hypothetical protein
MDMYCLGFSVGILVGDSLPRADADRDCDADADLEADADAMRILSLLGVGVMMACGERLERWDTCDWEWEWE